MEYRTWREGLYRVVSIQTPKHVSILTNEFKTFGRAASFEKITKLLQKHASNASRKSVLDFPVGGQIRKLGKRSSKIRV